MNIAVIRTRPDLAANQVEIDFSARETATSDVATIQRLLAAGARLLCAPAEVLRQLKEDVNGAE